jgi:hypothetical protein
VHTLLKVFGALLLIPGGLFLILVPVAAFDDGKAAVGLVILGSLLAIPGGLLLRAGIKRQRDTETQAQMAGFVRSHDAFTLDELAAHIGKTPAQTRTMLTRDIAKYQLPLVMHRQSGRYLRLDRLSRKVQLAERCQNCGGSLDNQIVFEGERLTCPYCNSLVQTHTPAQVGWNQAEGAWGQHAWAAPQYQPHAHYAPAFQQQQQQQPPPPQHHGGGPWGHG